MVGLSPRGVLATVVVQWWAQFATYSQLESNEARAEGGCWDFILRTYNLPVAILALQAFANFLVHSLVQQWDR